MSLPETVSTVRVRRIRLLRPRAFSLRARLAQVRDEPRLTCRADVAEALQTLAAEIALGHTPAWLVGQAAGLTRLAGKMRGSVN